MDKPTGTLHMYRKSVTDISQVSLLSEQELLSEAEASRADYVLKIGLARDKTKLNYYRRVLKNPAQSVKDPTLRPYAGEILSTLLDILFTDSTVWNRTKTVLTRRKQSVKGLREEISDSGLRSLIEKAIDSEVSLEIILEVYSRGSEIGGEREGFGRVNSFLAGGKALEMDGDLLGIEPIREEKKQSETLSVIRRVLKEKKQ